MTTNARCETPSPNIDWPQRFLMSWLLPLVHYCPIKNSLPPSFPGSHVACHCQTTPLQGPPQYSVSIVPSPLPLVHTYCFVIKTSPDYFACHHHHPCASHFLTCYVQELSSRCCFDPFLSLHCTGQFGQNHHCTIPQFAVTRVVLFITVWFGRFWGGTFFKILGSA